MEYSEEVIRELQFFKNNPRLWWLLNCDDDISADVCQEMINLLIEQEMYYLVPVIIARSKALKIENFIYKLFLQKLTESWQGKNIENIKAEFLTLLEEEMKSKEEEKVE